MCTELKSAKSVQSTEPKIEKDMIYLVTFGIEDDVRTDI